jgi:hypothetical protein
MNASGKMLYFRVTSDAARLPNGMLGRCIPFESPFNSAYGDLKTVSLKVY